MTGLARRLVTFCALAAFCTVGRPAPAQVDRWIIRAGPPLDPPSPFPRTLLRVFRHESRRTHCRHCADVSRWRRADADRVITARCGRRTFVFEVARCGHPPERHRLTAASAAALAEAVRAAARTGAPTGGGSPAIPRPALVAFEKGLAAGGTSPDELIRRRAHLGRAVRAAPDWALARLELGRAIAEQGDAAASLAPLRKARELDPDHPDVQAELGLAYRRVGRVAEAISCYTRALELAPYDPQVHNNHAIALLAADLPDAAERHLRKAVELEPRYPDAHLNLGTLLVSKGRDREAETHYDRAVELAPGEPGPRIALARQLTSRGRLRRAAALLEEAVEANPTHAAARFEYALALARRRRHVRAVDQLKQVLALEPDHREATYNLGICCVHAGRPAEAIELFEAEIKRRPDVPELYYGLGLGYEAREEKTLARAAFEMALEKDREFRPARIALERMRGESRAPELAWPWGGWCRSAGGAGSSPASCAPAAITLAALFGPALLLRRRRKS